MTIATSASKYLSIDEFAYSFIYTKWLYKKAEADIISRMMNQYKSPLTEQRNVCEQEIAQLMERTGNDYIEKCKSEFSKPMYRYRQQMNRLSEEEETEFGLKMHWQVYF